MWYGMVLLRSNLWNVKQKLSVFCRDCLCSKMNEEGTQFLHFKVLETYHGDVYCRLSRMRKELLDLRERRQKSNVDQICQKEDKAIAGMNSKDWENHLRTLEEKLRVTSEELAAERAENSNLRYLLEHSLLSNEIAKTSSVHQQQLDPCLCCENLRTKLNAAESLAESLSNTLNQQLIEKSKLQVILSSRVKELHNLTRDFCLYVFSQRGKLRKPLKVGNGLCFDALPSHPSLESLTESDKDSVPLIETSQFHTPCKKHSFELKSS